MLIKSACVVLDNLGQHAIATAYSDGRCASVTLATNASAWPWDAAERRLGRLHGRRRRGSRLLGGGTRSRERRGGAAPGYGGCVGGGGCGSSVLGGVVSLLLTHELSTRSRNVTAHRTSHHREHPRRPHIVVMKVAVAAEVDRRYSGVASVGLYGIKLTIKIAIKRTSRDPNAGSAALRAPPRPRACPPQQNVLVHRHLALLLVQGVWGRMCFQSSHYKRGSG